MLQYGVFNRLIPDAALSISVDPIGEVITKIKDLRIFGKKSVLAKFKTSIMLPGLPSTLFLVFYNPCISSFTSFTFLS